MSSTISRKPKISESCSKETDLRSILRQIEYGVSGGP